MVSQFGTKTDLVQYQKWFYGSRRPACVILKGLQIKLSPNPSVIRNKYG